MKVIPFESRVDNKPQAAFVIFFARDGKPWANYPHDNITWKNLTVPTCLMINRAHGDVGFVGGKVDEGESLEVAAKREVKEEIWFAITSKLEPIVAHDIGPITTHAFAIEMTYEKLREIQKNATNGTYFGSEVTGIFLPHLIDYDSILGKKEGLINLLKSSFAPSVREELIHFLLKKDIIKKEILTELCQKTGYKLSMLLK